MCHLIKKILQLKEKLHEPQLLRIRQGWHTELIFSQLSWFLHGSCGSAISFNSGTNLFCLSEQLSALVNM